MLGIDFCLLDSLKYSYMEPLTFQLPELTRCGQLWAIGKTCDISV
jgi:hypothetical protein